MDGLAGVSGLWLSVMVLRKAVRYFILAALESDGCVRGWLGWEAVSGLGRPRCMM